MRFSKYLIVSRTSAWKASARITDKKPSLRPGEISLYLTLDMPDALFERPALKAEIKIDDSIAPSVISAEVIDNIKQVLSENLNLNVEVIKITQ